MGTMLSMQYIFKERDSFLPVVDGQISDDFLFLAAVILIIVYGITMLILVRHVEKKKKEEKPDQADIP